MRVAKVNIYPFSELREDVKEIVIQKYRETQLDYDWYQCVIDDWTVFLEAYGFDNPKIAFSGFWSQGDGASFTCDNVDFHNIVDEELKCEDYKWEDAKQFVLCSRAYEAGLLSANVYRTDTHYSHRRTVSLSFDETFNVPSTKVNNLSRASDYLYDHLRDKIMEFSDKIYADLEKEYDWLSSDEQISETLSEECFEFTGEGVPWNG